MGILVEKRRDKEREGGREGRRGKGERDDMIRVKM